MKYSCISGIGTPRVTRNDKHNMIGYFVTKLSIYSQTSIAYSPITSCKLLTDVSDRRDIC